MTDFAPLGFQIDTSGLTVAKTEAQRTVTELVKVADAADKVAAASKTKADALRRAAEEARKAAEAAKTASAEEAQAADVTARAAERAATRAAEAAKAKTAHAEAIRKSAEAARAEAAAHDQSGNAASRAADRARLLAEATNVVAMRATTATGAIQGLAGSLGSGSVGGLTSAATSTVSLLARVAGAAGAIPGIVGAASASVAILGASFLTAANYLSTFEDRARRLEGRMRNTLGSVAAGSRATSAIQDLSQSTGLGNAPTSDAFLRQARNREDIGATTSEILLLVELTQKLGVVSGASRGEIASGTLQLSQALAAGKLNGDELRSIMENMPALAKAIADGLGVSVGQLRNMGAEGQLTSDKVFAAILSQTEKIRKEFGSLPETVEQANARLGDSFDRLFANVAKRANASGVVRWTVNTANDVVKTLADVTETDTGRIADAASARLREQIAEAERYLKLAEDRRAAGRESVFMPGANWEARADASVDLARARRDALRGPEEQSFRREERRGYGAYVGASLEEMVKSTAAVSRGMKISDELLQVAAKQKEAETQTKTLTEALAALKATSDRYTPEELAKKTNTLTAALTAARAQADGAKDSFAKMQAETDKMVAARAKYGSGGVDFGLDVTKAIEAARGNGRNVSQAEAESQVIVDRLLKASIAAGKETSAILDLHDELAAAARGQEALTRVRAELAKARELGDRIAEEAGGQALIRQAGIDAVEKARLGSLISQKATAEKETKELADLKDAIVAAGRGRDELARVQAEQRARMGLGAAADTTEGAAAILEAGKRALERRNLERQMQNAQSELPVEPRTTGDVRRTMEDLRRAIDDLNAMAGMDAAGRAARQFESALAKDLKTIPADMRAGYEAMKRAEFDAQQGLKAGDFVKGYADRLRMTQEEAKLEGLIGRERRIAAEVLKAEQAARQQGVTLTEQQRAQVSGLIEAQITLNEELAKSRQFGEDMRGAFSDMGSGIRSTIGDAIGGAVAQGKNFGEAFASGMRSVLSRLISQMFDAATKPLFDQIFGSKTEGGIFGSLFQAGGAKQAAVGGGSAVAKIFAPGAVATPPTASVGAYSSLLSSISTTGRASTVAGLDPAFRDSLGRMVTDARAKFGDNALALNSGFRSNEEQAVLWQQALTKYGSADAARKWVAPPGMSQHNRGTAADLAYASPAVKDWAHQNAGNYGLRYRMQNEDWHIEPDPNAGLTAIEKATMGVASASSQAAQQIDVMASASKNAATATDLLTKGLGATSGGAGGAPMSILPTQNAETSIMDKIGNGVTGLFSGIGGMFKGIFSSVFDGFGSIFKTLFGGFFAEGGTFDGQMVHRASALAMPGGKVGVIGERGPEAVLPLTRTSSGRLGVEASTPSFGSYANVPQAGGGGAPNVLVPISIVNQHGGADVDVKPRGQDGRDGYDILIRRVERHVESTFDVNRKKRSR